MELTQILIIVGVIGAVILVIVAIRGSFKSDDAFYGESPPMPGPASSGDDGQGQPSLDSDGATGGEASGSEDEAGIEGGRDGG
jgi:hypothetical protein